MKEIKHCAVLPLFASVSLVFFEVPGYLHCSEPHTHEEPYSQPPAIESVMSPPTVSGTLMYLNPSNDHMGWGNVN